MHFDKRANHEFGRLVKTICFCQNGQTQASVFCQNRFYVKLKIVPFITEKNVIKRCTSLVLSRGGEW